MPATQRRIELAHREFRRSRSSRQWNGERFTGQHIVSLIL